MKCQLLGFLGYTPPYLILVGIVSDGDESQRKCVAGGVSGSEGSGLGLAECEIA